jgi:hypothetical protein
LQKLPYARVIPLGQHSDLSEIFKTRVTRQLTFFTIIFKSGCQQAASTGLIDGRYTSESTRQRKQFSYKFHYPTAIYQSQFQRPVATQNSDDD